MVHFQDLHGSMLQYYRVFCLFFCSYVLFQFSLSLPHFCDFIHIFTSSLAFFHLTFHLASYGLQYFDFFFFPYQHIQNYKLLIVFPSDCHTARSLVSSHTPFLHLAVRHLNSVPSLPRPSRSKNFLPYFLPLRSLSLPCQLPSPKKTREPFLHSGNTGTTYFSVHLGL